VERVNRAFRIGDVGRPKAERSSAAMNRENRRR